MKKSFLWVLIVLFFILGFLASKTGIINISLLVLVPLAFSLFFTKYETTTYILALYPFVDFFFRNFLPGFSSIWDELLFLFMLFIWFYKYIAHRKIDNFKQTPLDMPIILFIIAMVIVFIVNSPDYRISLEGFRAVVQYILWFFVVIQLLKDENSAKLVCLVFVLAVSLMAIHGVYQFIVGVEIPSGWVDQKEVGVRTRVFSFLTSPNILGSLMTLALPICISFIFIFKDLFKKFIFICFSFFMVLTLVFTFSRGAWIGFAAAISLYVFLKDKRLFIPVIIIGVLLVILVPGISNRISYMLSPEYIESSLRGGRLVRWINGLKILANAPLFGVGLGHFGGAVATNNNLVYSLGVNTYEAFYMDNYYLKTAVETGLFGGISFIILMYQIVVNGIRTINLTSSYQLKELEKGIVAGLFGIIIHNFVENVFEVPMMTSCFWLLVAVLMHLWYINFKNINS